MILKSYKSVRAYFKVFIDRAAFTAIRVYTRELEFRQRVARMYSYAKCDITGSLISINEGFLVANKQTGEWFFCQQEVVEKVPNFFRWDGADTVTDQLQLVKVMANLSEKSWFDSSRFFEKLKKL